MTNLCPLNKFESKYNIIMQFLKKSDKIGEMDKVQESIIKLQELLNLYLKYNHWN